MACDGVVIRWLAEKKFGFIKCDADGLDVWVHKSSVEGKSELAVGYRVSFDRVDDGKSRGKFKAEGVKIVGAASLLGDLLPPPSLAPEQANGISSFLRRAGKGEDPDASALLSRLSFQSSLGCSFVVVSDCLFIEGVNAPSSHEFTALCGMLRDFIKACEAESLVLLVDFEGEMPGQGGELSVAQLQVTSALCRDEDGSFVPRSGSNCGEIVFETGLLLDLRSDSVVDLLRQIMQSPFLTKVFWGARGDFSGLMHQAHPRCLDCQPVCVLDAQLGFDSSIGMGRMLEQVHQYLLEGLPAKEQIDWDEFHARNCHALSIPLSTKNARYAVDDLHRLEIILRSRNPGTGSYAAAQRATDALLESVANDPFGVMGLKQELERLHRANKHGAVRRAAKAVEMARRVIYMQLPQNAVHLTESSQELMETAWEAATAALHSVGLAPPTDLSLADAPSEGFPALISSMPQPDAAAGGYNSRPTEGQRDVLLSKAMSMVLRHNATDLGLDIQPDGFCFADDLLRVVQEVEDASCTCEDMERIVKSCAKQRFELLLDAGVDGRHLIRATQGHSLLGVEDSKLLVQLEAGNSDLPENCIHGTYLRHFDDIMRFGLRAGGPCPSTRKHVHFAEFLKPQEGSKVTSGIKAHCDLAFWIDLPLALQDGVPFFRSQNGVLLSPGVNGVIEQKYFCRAKNLASDTWLELSLPTKVSSEEEFELWRREKLKALVLEQAYFYFRPERYESDKVLQSLVDDSGWIHMNRVITLSRFKKLDIDATFLVDCLKLGQNGSFELSCDGKRIRQATREASTPELHEGTVMQFQ